MSMNFIQFNMKLLYICYEPSTVQDPCYRLFFPKMATIIVSRAICSYNFVTLIFFEMNDGVSDPSLLDLSSCLNQQTIAEKMLFDIQRQSIKGILTSSLLSENAHSFFDQPPCCEEAQLAHVDRPHGEVTGGVQICNQLRSQVTVSMRHKHFTKDAF